MRKWKRKIKGKKTIKSVLISSSENKLSIFDVQRKAFENMIVFFLEQKDIFYSNNMLFDVLPIVTWIAFKKSKFLSAKNHHDHVWSKLTCSVRICSFCLQL